MLKKLSAILILIAMTAALAGCGNDKDSSSKNESSATTEAITEEITEEETETLTEAPAESGHCEYRRKYFRKMEIRICSRFSRQRGYCGSIQRTVRSGGGRPRYGD